jgi:glutamate dehydrogenase/leucine dehydrogenase
VTRDSWTGEDLVERTDEETGARLFVALHSSRLGPPTGGTRMKTYPDDASARRDAMRLSEAMTYKWAAADFPRGGGKAVIAVAPGMRASARPGLLRRYGTLLSELGGRFYTGGDVGTSSSDMDVIAETGAPYVFSRTPERGGAGGSGSWTALGVFAAIEAVCERLFGDPSPRGRRAVVQGAGSVGAPLIERLAAAGARVAVADPDPDAVLRLRERLDIDAIPTEACLSEPADLLVPCALGGILEAETISRLRARAIVGAANDQLAGPEDASRLRERGVLYAPDFIVNAGGAVAITGIEALGWSAKRAETAVRGIGGTLRRVFDLAEASGITTDEAARRLAEDRLRRGPGSQADGR